MSKYYKIVAEDGIITKPSDWDDLLMPKVSEDCISREWLETNFQTVCENVRCNECPFEDDDCRLIKFIVDAPSVIPKPKEAHYIKDENGEWCCSNCKRIEDDYSVVKFCWYCGAKMKGAKE